MVNGSHFEVEGFHESIIQRALTSYEPLVVFLSFFKRYTWAHSFYGVSLKKYDCRLSLRDSFTGGGFLELFEVISLYW